MKKRSIFVFWLMLVCVFCSSCQAESGSKSAIAASNSPYSNEEKPQILPKVSSTLAGKPLDIMLARTNSERASGLMFYESMPENEGMLFVYSSPRIMSFWMFNTKIPLDIVFFSDQLAVTEWIESMEPGYGLKQSLLPRYVSQFPAQYALELNSGAIKKLGISVGDRLEIPLTLLYSD